LSYEYVDGGKKIMAPVCIDTLVKRIILAGESKNAPGQIYISAVFFDGYTAGDVIMKSETWLVQANIHTPQVIACGIADQLLKNIVVSVVFFYRTCTPHEVLRDALKTVLNDFQIFAGTLTADNGKLFIDCNNTGVLFSINTDNRTLEQVLHDLPRIKSKELVDMINPKKAIIHHCPVMTIKLTYLACGGMLLGVCWHHSIGDMQTFMCLMQAWSQTVNKDEPTLPLIVSDRDAYLQRNLKDNKNTTPGVRYLNTRELLLLLFYLLVCGRNKSELRFYFSRNELRNMKQEFSAKTQRKLSKNDVLCAHVFSMISAVDAYQKPRMLSIAVNFRYKAQLPSNLLGNFVSSMNILTNPTVDPVQCANELRTSIDNFQRLHLDFFSTRAYIQQNGGLPKIERFLAKFIDPVNRTLLITNWCNFGVYDVIFGEAKPCYFAPVIDSPIPWLSIISDGFSNNGLVYTVPLPNPLAKKLMQEENLKKMHQYRDQNEVLPEWVEKLGWVL
jgi:shikimate O-hydroxycinnamoyltransferase